MWHMTHVNEQGVQFFLPATEEVVIVSLHRFGGLSPCFVLLLGGELLCQFFSYFLLQQSRRCTREGEGGVYRDYSRQERETSSPRP